MVVKRNIQLLNDLPRGRHAKHIGNTANSFFEAPEDIVATESLRFEQGNPHSKILLGVVDGEIVNEDRLPDGRVNRWVRGGQAVGVIDDRHLITVAGSRAGKGRSALLPNFCNLPHDCSIYAFDPKGILCQQTLPYRSTLQKVGVLDPFNCTGYVGSSFEAKFNPISKLVQSLPEDLVSNANLIGDALITNENPYDQHWTDTAKQAVSGLCVHTATHINYEGRRDLVTVWKLASELKTKDPSDPNLYWLESEMRDSDAANGMVRAAARNFYDRTGGEFNSVLSNLRKYLDFISIGCVQESLRGESIDFRDLKRDSLCVYVSLPAMRMDALKGWLRMVTQFAINAFEEEPIQVGPQCLMILDEFHILGKISILETAMALLAGLGLKIWIVAQDLNQLRKHHPKSYETFIANAGVIQVFGCSDNSTLSYFSKQLGKALTLTRTSNAPTYEQAVKQAATGESWSLSNHPLMDEEELRRFLSRDDHLLRQLVLRPGYRPMLLQRVFYDKHELCSGKFYEAES